MSPSSDSHNAENPSNDPNLHDLIARFVRAFGLINQQVSNFQLSPEVRNALIAANELHKTVAPRVRRFHEVLEPYARAAVPYLRAAALAAAFYDRVRKIYETTGLLYHYTFPNELIVGENAVKDHMENAVLEHYRGNWRSVSSEIETNIDQYTIPKASREALKEGLHAHGIGLYQAVPRIVFPEIERVLVNSGYNFSSPEFVKDVKTLGSTLTLEEFPDAILGMPTWEKFVDHVYKTVKTPAQVAYHQGHPVPNRHAAIHGRVTYDTQVQSLNSIFLVDFMMRLLPAAGFLNPTKAAPGSTST